MATENTSSVGEYSSTDALSSRVNATNSSAQPAMMPGFSSGSVMLRNVLNHPAPHDSEASSSSGWICINVAEVLRTPIGR